MTNSDKATETRFEKASKRIPLILSILAFALSAYNFIDQHLLNQHVLRVAVVSLEQDPTILTAKLLLVNPGKHDETLYNAQFLYADKLYGKTSLGPIVLKPGEARVEILREPLPSVKDLRNDGTLEPNADRLHIAVEFVPVTRNGEILEDGTVYGFTEWKLNGNDVSGASPKAGDRSGLIDLRM